MFLPSKVAEIVKAFTTLKDVAWVFHPLFDVKTDELEKENFNPLVDSEFEVSYVKIDFRDRIKDGKQPEFVPQTSALSFSREILNKFFPIPEDRKTDVGDTYTAMTSVFLSKGCVIDKTLSVYRLHDNNAYSTRQIDKQRETFAKLRIATAYWLRRNFPMFSKYNNMLFSKGLACFWLIENADVRDRKFIREYFSYLSIPEKILVLVKSLYYFQKTLLCKSLP